MNHKIPLPLAFKKGFTLVELLVVIGIVVLLGGLTAPALRSLGGAGNVNYAIAGLSGTLEVARAYAMANNTYVRVGIADLSADGISSVLVLLIYAANGSLDADTAADMADGNKWPALSKPLHLKNLTMDSGINTESVPDTRDDITPIDVNADIPDVVTREVSGFSTNPRFSSFIQFNPSGEARVAKDTPARYIKIGMTQASTSDNNPFILRLSGTNGSVTILREENGIKGGI